MIFGDDRFLAWNGKMVSWGLIKKIEKLSSLLFINKLDNLGEFRKKKASLARNNNCWKFNFNYWKYIYDDLYWKKEYNIITVVPLTDFYLNFSIHLHINYENFLSNARWILVTWFKEHEAVLS